MLRPMRATWIALAAILGMGLLGAYLLGRALEKATPKPSLAPRGARVIDVNPLSDDQRVLRWQIGGHPEDPDSGLYGVTIVEGNTRLYSHRASPHDSRVNIETGDFSGDGRKDVLVFDDLGGSGGCGTYRAIVTGPGSARPVLRRHICEDLGSIHLRGRGLLTAVGLKKDPKTRLSIHCCYLRVRTDARALERDPLGSRPHHHAPSTEWPTRRFRPGRPCLALSG